MNCPYGNRFHKFFHIESLKIAIDDFSVLGAIHKFSLPLANSATPKAAC
jgi:hypothetical protein